MFVKYDRAGFVSNICVKEKHKKVFKQFKGPNLGPLKYFFFVVFFDINIKNKAYSIKFYKHIVSNYKNIASYLLLVWKKKSQT